MKTPHLIVPYTLDTNDMRFATAQGFHTGDQFAQYLIDAFDVLYAEVRNGTKDAVDRVALPVDWAASAICRIGQIPGSYHGA